jgi:peptidoglycan lytic transglycosylase B
MMLRRSFLMLAFALASTRADGEDGASLQAFLGGLWRDAAARGIKRTTFEAAFTGVTPDAAVLAAMRRQPEYSKPFGSYVASLVSPARIETGKRKSAQWAATLRAVEKKFGLEESILVSVWGIESSFGEASGDRWDVFRSLATLADAGFQHPFFREELFSALKILQDAHAPRRQFVGSWAGAMGQAQFLPSSYLAYAVDFDGDGYADIWRSVPDTLASIANYLQKFGWQPGLPWGFEVTVPQRFDYGASRGTFSEWAQRGLSRADGGSLPDSGSAILFFPSGAGGPAFLVTANFVVLKRYNNSDAYALAVAELSGRLRGLSPIRTPWPADDVQPSRGERIALQRRLSELGYRIEDFQGHLDFDLRDAVRDQQQKFGMIPDGYPSRAFLSRIGVHPP